MKRRHDAPTPGELSLEAARREFLAAKTYFARRRALAKLEAAKRLADRAAKKGAA